MASSRAAAGAVFSLLVALATSGCSERWWLGPFERRPARAPEAVSWVPLSADGVVALIDHRAASAGRTRFQLHLPPPAEGAPPYSRVELRFRAPLDGARVDADGRGPRHQLRLLDGQRLRGDTVTIELAPFQIETVTVDVHHHLRPVPIVAAVRLGRAVGQ